MTFNLTTVVGGYTMRVATIPGYLQFAIFALKLFISLATFVLCFLMAGRNNKARKIFLFALPLLFLSGLFSFYANWLSFGNGFGIAFPSLAMIAFVVYLALTLLALFIYQARFMKRPTDEEGDEGILNDVTISEED